MDLELKCTHINPTISGGHRGPKNCIQFTVAQRFPVHSSEVGSVHKKDASACPRALNEDVHQYEIPCE